MSRRLPLGRRPVLTGGLALAASGALAACGSDSGDTGSGGSAAKDQGEAATGPGGLVALADVPVGSAVGVEDADGKPVIVAQPSQGDVVAFTAVCTHKGCTVKPEGKELKCPCHGSVYDAFTGKNLSGPAPSPLAAIAVKVEGDQVVEG